MSQIFLPNTIPELKKVWIPKIATIASVTWNLEYFPPTPGTSTSNLFIINFIGYYNCIVLHCTSLHCTVQCCAAHSTAHSTALHCTALHCTALHCTALHCTALHCTALHCTALHCTALHYTALHYTTLHCTVLNFMCSGRTFHLPHKQK